MTTIPNVVPYFDLSFQHAAPALLRRMRRFGDPDSFLALIESIRAAAPAAGIRSNVICGFPGETEADLEVLTGFLTAAGLDAVGVFGYSDEDGTEAARLDHQLDADDIEQRRAAVADLAQELVAQRAEERVGEPLRVLVEEPARPRSAGPRTGTGGGRHRVLGPAGPGRSGGVRRRCRHRLGGDRPSPRECADDAGPAARGSLDSLRTPSRTARGE